MTGESVPAPLHADEIPVDAGLARSLVARDFPEYADLPVRRLGPSGSSNALFRLGEELLVRLPRQPGGSAAIDKEHRWLPRVAPALGVAVPTVLGVGGPGYGYAERWSVVCWLDGTVPGPVGPEAGADPGRARLAADLARVVVGLRRVDVPVQAREAPELRWYRGEALRALDETTRVNIEACRRVPGLELDLDTAARTWEEAVRLPGTRGPHWYHGDLLGENLLVRDGRLAAVLDFGGLGVGDPTVDLMPAWELLDPSSRALFRSSVGVDDQTWLRGRAWALAIALMTFPYYWGTMPGRCASRLAMARNVLVDAGAERQRSRA